MTTSGSREGAGTGRPGVAVLAPLALLAILLGILFGPGLPGLDRRGVPVEEVAVERVTLTSGEITLRVRNDGPDPVRIVQAIVNDAYVPTARLPGELGRLSAGTARIPFDWVEGERYDIALVTATGVTLPATIEAAVETPGRDAGLFGSLALIGLYVGLVPVLLGMLWLPAARRARPATIRFILALTLGVLAFLGIEALVDGIEIAGSGAASLGGAVLPLAGVLAGLAAVVAAEGASGARARGGMRLALLIALGVGMHNLGEGLAIGSAYAVGELALGALLIAGFALHNTTEGLAIVSPLTSARPRLGSLLGLGALAGLPVVAGAWLGSLAVNPALVGLILGMAAGAILQVILRVWPAARSRDGSIDAVAALGVLCGLVVMYATGLVAAGA